MGVAWGCVVCVCVLVWVCVVVGVVVLVGVCNFVCVALVGW